MDDLPLQQIFLFALVASLLALKLEVAIGGGGWSWRNRGGKTTSVGVMQ